MANTKFYNAFFKIRGSFLDGDQSSLYSERAYLASLGFSPETDWEGRSVCEMGAGAGRMTASLHGLGLVSKARRYALVEPSGGIAVLKEKFAGGQFKSGQFEFYAENLAEFAASHAGEFDYVIAHGVIPHIEGELIDILKDFRMLLAENGTLHIIHSFYGYPKTCSRFFWKLCRRTAFAIRPLSFLAALLQIACDNRFLEGFYKKNFMYSFQKTFTGIYRQHYEYHGVSPYNIFHGYRFIFNALSLSGFSGAVLHPHSIALSAKRGGGSGDSGAPHVPANRPLAIIGNDWSCRWVRKQLRHLGDVRCVDDVSDVRPEDIVVLGHDYMSAAPYYATVERFTRAGRVFGKDIFLFQMLLR